MEINMTKAVAEDYHWTPTAMRAFLAELADTGIVRLACEAAGKSRQAAYDLRRSDEGAAFRLGWDAALIEARVAIADAVTERAVLGYEEVSERDPETNRITRLKYDNRAAMGLLNRLDRLTGYGAAPGSDAALALIIAKDFNRFLDLVESGGTGADAALFLSARTPQTSAPACQVTDYDIEKEPKVETPPTPEEEAQAMKVWWHDYSNELVTNFPPPPGFEGTQKYEFGDKHYSRTLTERETEAIDLKFAEQIKPLIEAGRKARNAWFGFVPEGEEDGAQMPEAANDGGEHAGVGLCAAFSTSSSPRT
jgi:hypothetical protein